MKKKLFFLPIILTTLSLTSCFGDDEWKKEFGTPELFLSQVGDYSLVYLYGADNNNRGEDIDYEIRNALLEAAPFTETNKKSSEAERYFTYQAFWQPATSGPNFCNMSVYDDGFIKIHHKKSLGPNQYVYFTMDEAKATSIVDMVFAKITPSE